MKKSKSQIKLKYLIIGLIFILFSCDGEDGENGNDGVNGANSLIISTIEAPGNNCQNGGLLIQIGLDVNENGTLEPEEVNSTSFVCNGIDQYQNLIRITNEPPSINCVNGGQTIRTGLDLNNNGILEDNEVNNTVYVCNGLDGINSLIKSTSEEAGENCTNGGIKIEFGLDNNANGILDEAEITSTSYVCNGTVESQDQVIINNLITDEIQDALDEFNIVLPEGTNPPNLEGAYFCNSLVLENSNIPSDNIGGSFNDFTFQVKDQNSTDLTATIFTKQGSTVGSGTGGFIVGDDNKFAILFEQLAEDTTTNGKLLSINIYLGELREDGVANFELIIVGKDDFGDPNDQFIEIGQGRYVIEQDGFSPKVDDDISSKTQNNVKSSLPKFIYSFPFK